MDRDGRRISIFLTTSASAPHVDWQQLEGLIAHSDIVALNIIDYCRRLIPVAQRLGKPIWCDIHDYDGRNPYHQDFIDGADYIFLSTDALPAYRPFGEKRSCHPFTPSLVEPLTARELEVLRLIADGAWNHAIAAQLVITVGTVKRHINNLFDKLGVRSRTQAIRAARAMGLLEQ